jgi:two-component system chemotaxis response regulator CheB
MAGHDIIVIGASAGGVEALKQLVTALPADLRAAVFVVIHIPPFATSAMPAILRRAGHLQAAHAQENQLIEMGRIYIAPPDHHLLLKYGYVNLSRGPTENGSRPAIDPLFRTAARAYDSRVIGVVLSGTLDDGTAGLLAIKERGGLAVVQDPTDALYPGMPTSAIENVQVDHVVPISEMAALLAKLTAQPAPGNAHPVPEEMATEADMAELDPHALHKGDRPGEPSGFVCPDCGGTLFEINEGEFIRFRCRVGHAYSAETLLAEQMIALEDAFWVALRTLEESAAFAHKLAERSQSRGSLRSAERFEEQAETAEKNADIVRGVLLSGTLNVFRAETNSEPGALD